MNFPSKNILEESIENYKTNNYLKSIIIDVKVMLKLFYLNLKK